MLRKMLVSLVAIVLALSLSGIAMAENVMYTSRDVQVPATVVLPDGEGPFPLVVLAHDMAVAGKKTSDLARLLKR